MLDRGLIGAIALVAGLCLFHGGAVAFDDAQYPDFNGKWNRLPFPGAPRTPQPTWDPTKGWGKAQGAPLTPEYAAIFAANEADQALGRHHPRLHLPHRRHAADHDPVPADGGHRA